MARILIISEDLWYPPNYGMGLREYHLLRYLSQIHDYTWCCRFLRKRTPEEEAGINFARSESIFIPRPNTFLKIIKVIPYLVSGRPLRQAGFNFKKLWKRIRHLTATESFDIIQIEHTMMAEYVKAIDPSCGAIKVLAIQNIDHVLYKRLAEIEPRLFRRLFLHSESKKYRRFEEKILGYFDAFIAVSKENINWLKELGVSGPIHLSLNGVDVKETPFFQQSTEPILIMPGSLDYLPNSDAARYFSKQILPLILAKKPDVRLLIVGRNPGKEVKVLESNPKVTVVANVPDMTPFYKRAAVTVVPLRSGAGTRLKIVESMAYGRVVISTTIGAEGLDYEEGENIFIADDPKRIAETIVKLLDDINLREKISLNARNHVEKGYDYIQIADELNTFYQDLLLKRQFSA